MSSLKRELSPASSARRANSLGSTGPCTFSREAAALLLPQPGMDVVIRRNALLGGQIEPKMRQFYARRRQSSLRRAEGVPGEVLEPPAAQSHTVGGG